MGYGVIIGVGKCFLCFAALVLGVLMHPAGANHSETQLVTRTMFRPAFNVYWLQCVSGGELSKLFRRVTPLYIT